MKTLEIEDKIVINKPVEQIFEYISVQENHKHIFSANIDSRQISEGPMRIGVEVVNTASFLGTKMREHFEIVDFEKNKKIEKKTLLGSTHPSSDRWTLVTLNKEQTEVQLYIIAWPTGILSYLLPLVKLLFARQINKDLKNLKRLVEAL